MTPRTIAIVSAAIPLLSALGCQRPSPANSSAALAELPPAAAGQLRSPEVFSVYADTGERSRALFGEAARVMLHPRCSNCHPSGNSPLQHEGLLHDPPVARGEEGRGVVGMECTSCHQAQNLELSRVPGAPDWHLAPLSMAWVGRDAASLCEQLKDPARNGKRTLEQIVEHSGHDALVAWGWAPGPSREPPPGSQAEFAALIEAWVASGAECPLPEPPTSSSGKERP